MELRSTRRSRSKTPSTTGFQPDEDLTTFEWGFPSSVEYSGDGNHVISRSIKKTTYSTKATTGSSQEGAYSSSEEYNNKSASTNLNRQSVATTNSSKNKSAKSSRSFKENSAYYKTSDYSSEEGELQETKHITQNQKNQIIEDAKRAANGSAEISALDLYRKAGRYWDKYPKTDWTYSPHSRDRVEIAPGVVQMPNMSRPTIHQYNDSSTNTDSYLYQKTSATSSSNSRYFDSLKQRLFTTSKDLSTTNNNTEDETSFKLHRVSASSAASSKHRRQHSTTITTTIVSKITSFFLSIYTYTVWSFYSAYQTQNSLFIWVAKRLHHLASRFMLVDTWFLKKQSTIVTSRRKEENSRSKMGTVVLLCLLPMLLFIGWWLFSTLGSAIYTAYFIPSTETTPIIAPSIVDVEKSEISQNIDLDDQSKNTQNQEVISHNYFEILRQEIDSLSRDLQNQQSIDTDQIVQKVLESPKIQNIFNIYNTHVTKIQKERQDGDEELKMVVENLKNDIRRIEDELSNSKRLQSEDLNRILTQLRTESAGAVARLSLQLKRCCGARRPPAVINLEPYITKTLGDFLNNPEFLAKQEGLSKYLSNLFVLKQEMEMHLANLTQNLPSAASFEQIIEHSASKIMHDLVDKMAFEKLDPSSLTEDRIKKIVVAALNKYDADKTGLVDYAMEPMGGQVLTTRCTETYHSGTAVVSILGVPIWYPTISPRTVITPGVNPGECWAFQNFPGFLVIKLSAAVKIEAFSYEHISRALVPGGKIDSAPKEFEVFGLREDNDKDPVLLGSYVYDNNGDSIQYFAAQEHGLVFEIVEIRIKSNHGNPNYTCLYRFRVHGSVSHETEPT